MTRRCVLTVAPLVLLAVLATAVRAAEDVLSMVPQEALGYVVVNRLAETDGKIQALGRQMQLPVPGLLDKLNEKTGFQNGLDLKGSAALVLMPGKDSAPAPAQVLFVPVTDFGRFLAPFHPDDASAKIVQVRVMGAPFLVGSDGGYAVFTEAKHREVLQQTLDSPNRVADDVAPMKKWLAENDVAGVVTPSGVELLAALGQAGLKKVKSDLTASSKELATDMEPAIAVFGVYEEMLKAIAKEVKVYAAGVRVDKDGAVHVTDWTLFKAGGCAAKMIGGIKPPEGDLLAGLPAGPFVAVGAGALPEELAKALTDFSVGIMKAAPKLYGLNDEQAARLAEISSQSMQGIRGMAMLLGVGKPDASLFSNMVAVMKVDDSKAYLANYRKTLKAMNELLQDVESPVLPATEAKDISVGDVSALEISMKYPAVPKPQNIPGYEQMMKAFFGSEGKLTVYLAAADDHTIVTAYISKDLLAKCLKATERPQAGLAGDEGLAKTAAMLPAGAPWVGYWSPRGTIDFVNRIVPTFAPPEAAFKLPEFPDTPPVGFAGETTPDGLRTYMVVPAPVVKAIGGYIGEVKKMQQAGAPEAEEVEAR